MTNQESAPRSLGMPTEVAREKVMMDPTAKEMAEVLGLTLEEFAKRVVESAQRPDEVELEVMDPLEEAEFGDEIPSEAEVIGWLQAVDRGDITFDDLPPGLFKHDALSSDTKEAAARRTAGLSTPMLAPRSDTPRGKVTVRTGDPMGNALKNQLMLQRARTIGHHAGPVGPSRTKPKADA